jgi:hypothetical protein
MEWTRDLPGKSGFYWLYDAEAEEPELVKVIGPFCHYEGGFEIIRMGSDVHDSILLGHYADEKKCSMLWFGPLDLIAPEGWETEKAA